MKTIKITYFLLIVLTSAVFFNSCEKSEDITVTFNNAGSLTVNVLDGNNQPCNDAIFIVYSNNEIIYIDSTTTTGLYNVGKLLYGEYQYYVSAKTENRVYYDSRVFQIVAGEDKVINVNPFANTTKVKINVIDSWGNPLSDVNVGLISGTYTNTLLYNDLVNSCYFIQATDENGSVLIDNVPVGSLSPRAYSILVYRNEQEWDYNSNPTYVIPRETREYTYYVNL